MQKTGARSPQPKYCSELVTGHIGAVGSRPGVCLDMLLEGPGVREVEGFLHCLRLCAYSA